MDISIIYLEPIINKSLQKAINYTQKRGINCEVITDRTKASGQYITECNKLTFYHEYYLHIAYVALEFRDPKCPKFCYTKICILENKEFYMGDYSSVLFERIKKTEKDYTFKESKIIPGCTLIRFKELNGHVPYDITLAEYYKYFFMDYN